MNSGEQITAATNGKLWQICVLAAIAIAAFLTVSWMMLR
jgi:hypothetical protein